MGRLIALLPLPPGLPPLPGARYAAAARQKHNACARIAAARCRRGPHHRLLGGGGSPGLVVPPRLRAHIPPAPTAAAAATRRCTCRRRRAGRRRTSRPSTWVVPAGLPCFVLSIACSADAAARSHDAAAAASCLTCSAAATQSSRCRLNARATLQRPRAALHVVSPPHSLPCNLRTSASTSSFLVACLPSRTTSTARSRRRKSTATPRTTTATRRATVRSRPRPQPQPRWLGGGACSGPDACSWGCLVSDGSPGSPDQLPMPRLQHMAAPGLLRACSAPTCPPLLARLVPARRRQPGILPLARAWQPPAIRHQFHFPARRRRCRRQHRGAVAAC